MESKSPLSVFAHFLLLLLIVVSLAIVGLWIIAVPEDKIKEMIEDALNREPISPDVNGIKKGLFYNVHIKRLGLKDKGAEMLYMEDISIKVNPLHLLLLRIESSFNGRINSGIISGKLTISMNKRHMDIALNNADINGIPYVEKIGIKGSGTLNARFIMDGNHGSIKFTVSDAQFETAFFSGVRIPMEIFNKAQGVVDINGNIVTIYSFSLEGAGIYGRLKGIVKDNTADLNLELMPDVSAQNRFVAIAFLERYKSSPGYYVIPIKARLPVRE